MKKNQIIVTILAVLIAVSGYLTFSNDLRKNKNEKEVSAGSEAVSTTTEENQEIAWNEDDIDILGEDESSDIGDAVLTDSQSVVASARITRENARAQIQESLNAIINNAQLSEKEKSEAVSKMVEIAGISEMEVAVESLLQAKGYMDCLVSITEQGADVVVYSDEITAAQAAQIMDIVKRKTGISNDKIVITPVKNQ